MADQLDRVLEEARALGFLGPGEILTHRQHAEGFLVLLDVDEGATVVDLGSGGGVPGLVLACALPRSRWVLLDVGLRRTTFLREAVERLGLTDRVTVHVGRAEEAGREPSRRQAADAVVARSFASPPVTAECAAPLLRPGGTLVVSEPPGGADRWPAEPLAELGLVVEAHAAGPPALVRLRQQSVAPDRFPRRVGVPAKRPLWEPPDRST